MTCQGARPYSLNASQIQILKCQSPYSKSRHPIEPQRTVGPDNLGISQGPHGGRVVDQGAELRPPQIQYNTVHLHVEHPCTLALSYTHPHSFTKSIPSLDSMGNQHYLFKVHWSFVNNHLTRTYTSPCGVDGGVDGLDEVGGMQESSAELQSSGRPDASAEHARWVTQP